MTSNEIVTLINSAINTLAENNDIVINSEGYRLWISNRNRMKAFDNSDYDLEMDNQFSMFDDIFRAIESISPLPSNVVLEWETYKNHRIDENSPV